MAEDAIPEPLKGHTKRTSRLLLRPMRRSDCSAIHEARKHMSVMRWTTSRPEATLADTERWYDTRILSSPPTVWNFIFELVAADERPTSELATKLKGDEGLIIGAIGAVGGPEIGYLIQPVFEGRGYGTEAARAFLELWWTVIPPSPRSNKASTPYVEPVDARQAMAAVPSGASGSPQPQHNPADKLDLTRSKAPHLLDGHDFIEATLDAENTRSLRLLRKLGFTLWSSTKDDFQSPNTGLRSTLICRLGRPGTELGPAPGPFELDDPFDARVA